MTPTESTVKANELFLTSDEAPIVELSFFVRRERFKSLVNLAENQNITVAQVIRSLIERQLEIDESAIAFSDN